MLDFFHAAVPEPFTILKLRLKPYSLGHIILLHRVESAFVLGQIPHLSDLVTSVFLCSQTYEEAVRALDNPKLFKFMRRWERTLGRVDVNAKSKEFIEYINAHSQGPIYKFEESKTRPTACPVVQAVKVALLSETNLTESQILNRCWSLCLWDFVTLMSRAGKVDIMDPVAIENAKAVADALAKKFNPKS